MELWWDALASHAAGHQPSHRLQPNEAALGCGSTVSTQIFAGLSPEEQQQMDVESL